TPCQPFKHTVLAEINFNDLPPPRVDNPVLGAQQFAYATRVSGGAMLSAADLATYRRDGFVVLPDILTRDEVEALRRVTEQFVRDARSVAANDDVYALEYTHSAVEPRVRRRQAP